MPSIQKCRHREKPGPQDDAGLKWPAVAAFRLAHCGHAMLLEPGDVCGIAALAWPAETVVLPSGTVQFALQLDAQPVRILMTNETECLAVGARRCPH